MVIVVVAVLIATLSGCSTVNTITYPYKMLINAVSKKTEYVLTENATEFQFSVTPEEYFEYDLPIFSECYGLQSSAKASGDTLILRLTESQKSDILAYYENSADKFGKKEGVEALPEYKGYIITGDRELVADIIGNKITFGLFRDCAFRQLFGGVDCDDISVSIKVVDINSQKTLYEASWPQETIELGVEDWDFSEESQ